MSWTLEEIRAGQMEVTLADGALRVYTWEDASHDPGWCKLDWVIADTTRGQLANASNVLDPTWEAPDGDDRAARRLPRPLLPGGLPRGRSRSRCSPSWSRSSRPTRSTTTSSSSSTRSGSTPSRTPNYGKAARRMYNVFRLTGRLPRGGLHPRAVRRAGHRAVPGLGADPDARRRGELGRRRSTRTRWSPSATH